MPSPPARDQLETDSLEPAENLLQRRRLRDEENYRVWCEATYELVHVGPELFHPADILDALRPDAARRGRDEAASQIRADLEDAVCERFPAPVAVPFHAFIEGPRSPIKRMHRLRDTWEALIRLLAALALAECTACRPMITRLVVRDGKNQPFRPCRKRDLRTDRLATRIGLIEGILQRANALNVGLEVAKLLPDGALTEIARLNSIRNGFSHESVKSDKQAEAIISDAYPVLREVLLDLNALEGVQLIRVKAIMPSQPPNAEVERLFGHAQSQRVHVMPMDEEMTPVVLAASAVDDMDRILARVGSHVLDLSPFYYAVDDETGHRTRIAVFKTHGDGMWSMEYVGDSVAIQRPAAPHEALLGRFAPLIVEDGAPP